MLSVRPWRKISVSNWCELFKGLKRRDLKAKEVNFNITGGIECLERVFKEEFPMAKVH
ncbi:MAG: hypothetical protein ACOWYE_10290 [Desulfatiglandales bacterium]